MGLGRPLDLDLLRPWGVDVWGELDHQQRADLRDLLSKQFAQGRTSPTLGSHNEAYQRVRGLMASDLFTYLPTCVNPTQRI